MLAPIRCIIQMAADLKEKAATRFYYDIQIIENTAGFLLNQVQMNLDYGLLQQNKLQAKFDSYLLKEQIICPVVDLFKATAKAKRVEIKLLADTQE